MVASAKSLLKASTLRKAQTNKRNLSSSFSLTWGHKIGHNSAVGGHIKFWLHPSCSSHDSASDEISVIDIKKIADRTVEAELDFNEKQAMLFIAL